MEDTPEPYSCFISVILSFFNTFNAEAATGLLIMFLLLVFSALVSGSEIAFFSLKHSQLNDLRESTETAAQKIIILLEKPKRLLATILITNNVVNIAVIILSTFVTAIVFNFEDYLILGFIVQIIVVTFLILLFAEVLPKVYATQHNVKFALMMAGTMTALRRVFYPMSSLLVKSTNFIDKRLAKKKTGLSANEISHAIDITHEEKGTEDDKQLLYGIVQFSNIYAREIMKSRMDVVAVAEDTPFKELIKVIVEAGYSRIPVYRESFDNVIGILYIKDLLPHLDTNEDIKWQKLIRNCFFVPESKKINDLLKEFQEKKIHMAVVVDEYGGTSGIVTLEDILEEIVGEINDEFDIEQTIYSKIDSLNYMFEGKTLLKDFCKITGVDYNIFHEIKGEADTMAGLILEIKQELPYKGEKVSFDDFELVVDAVDNRRIKRIHVRLKKNFSDE
ncbi:MAG: gliding motility-associated protein GldE [Bacteroidetes bacterium]|nr:MAG: gliding motility-associated protein GldE [Bacteroidota bacterium]